MCLITSYTSEGSEEDEFHHCLRLYKQGNTGYKYAAGLLSCSRLRSIAMHVCSIAANFFSGGGGGVGASIGWAGKLNALSQLFLSFTSEYWEVFGARTDFVIYAP